MNLEKDNQSDIITEGDYRRLKRRKIDVVRGIILVLTSAIALILFMMWYKSWPQRVDCYRTSVRLASALNNYYKEYHQLPPILSVLNVRPGRYNLSHYEYRFVGFGADKLRDGTIIAYCRQPHKSLFHIHTAWRHILVFLKGKIVVQWVTEDEFQKIMKSQPPTNAPSPY